MATWPGLGQCGGGDWVELSSGLIWAFLLVLTKKYIQERPAQIQGGGVLCDARIAEDFSSPVQIMTKNG